MMSHIKCILGFVLLIKFISNVQTIQNNLNFSEDFPYESPLNFLNKINESHSKRNVPWAWSSNSIQLPDDHLISYNNIIEAELGSDNKHNKKSEASLLFPRPGISSSPKLTYVLSEDNFHLFKSPLKFVGGSSSSEGFLALEESPGIWRTICLRSSAITQQFGDLICQKLGFSKGARRMYQGYFTAALLSIRLPDSEMTCSKEKQILGKVSCDENSHCNVKQHAIGLQCFTEADTGAECKPGEVYHERSCYSLHSAKTKYQAQEVCFNKNAHLLDLNTLEEVSFMDTWLTNSAPNITSVITSGIRIVALGLPLWIWQDSSESIHIQNWLTGSESLKAHQDRSKRPYCLVMKRLFACSQKPTIDLQILLNPNGKCRTDNFYWDGVLCDTINTQPLPFVCERHIKEVQNLHCTEEQFKCHSGECIADDRICDGYKDCAYGEDEETCSQFVDDFDIEPGQRLSPGIETWTNTSLPTCALHCVRHQHLRCRSFSYNHVDQTCSFSESTMASIPIARTVVFSDWSYYERKVTPWACENDQFTCKNGKCINASLICDGISHCKDHSDEVECNMKNIEIGFAVPNINKGYLLVKVDGVWKHYCSKFNKQLADVACKQLNFTLGAHSFYPNMRKTIPICKGNETSLSQCNFPEAPNFNCSQNQVVFLNCRQPINVIENAAAMNLTNMRMELRLVNGTNSTSGRVEVKRQGVWGTICDDDIADETADVICRGLGHTSPSFIVKNATFGVGLGKIWLDQVKCEGFETSLDDCHFSTEAEQYCDHEEDIGVVCSELKAESILTPLEKLEKSMREECGGNVTSDQHDVVPGSIPWQASIRTLVDGKSSHYCGAVIISAFHVLTAAHCVTSVTGATYIVRVGDHDAQIKEPGEAEFYIDRLYVHKDFGKGFLFSNDIAMIKVKGEIICSSKVKPVRLVPTLKAYDSSLNCSFSGWASEASSGGYERYLHRGYVTLLNTSHCNSAQIYNGIISEGMVCAGDLVGGMDAIKGYSGGPLTCQNEGKQYLYGLTSWGWGHVSGEPDKPGVYTNIAFYFRWIKNRIAESMV